MAGPAIIEYVRYDLPADRRPRSRPPTRASLAGHVHGFRESEPFQAFFGELSAFGEFRPEMEHSELIRNQLARR
jgi:hypothetical protein